MTRSDRLSDSQLDALAALLTNTTRRAAAREAGIGAKTLYRYLQDPDFVAELHRLQDAVLAGVVASVVGLAEDSVETLQDILWDEDVSAAVRARVALGWLSQMHKFSELRVQAEVSQRDLEKDLQAAIEKVYGDADELDRVPFK